MKFKHKKIVFILLGLLTLTLTACSNNSKTKAQMPSAKTILTKAQSTQFNSMQANWTEKSGNKTLQEATARYTKKPAVVYANVSATSNHYQMWIENSSNYIQMKGTNSKRWFKTKLDKNSAYATLTDSLNASMLKPFLPAAKKFKVKKANQGYTLTYQGNNKDIWNAIISDSAVTSLIGIDLDNVKPIKSQIQISVNQNYHVTAVKLASNYKDDNTNKVVTMKVDQINQIKQLTVPANVKKEAVDLGKLNKK